MDDLDGTFGGEYTMAGFFREGPQPARNPLQRLIQSSTAIRDPLPPHLALLALTRKGKQDRALRRMLARAAISPTTAAKGVEVAARKRLNPILVGKRRYGH